MASVVVDNLDLQNCVQYSDSGLSADIMAALYDTRISSYLPLFLVGKGSFYAMHTDLTKLN